MRHETDRNFLKLSVDTEVREFSPGGVLPYISHMGMCRPIG